MTVKPPTPQGISAGPEHTYNWTCFLVPAGSIPRDDDAPECQACRLEITREIVVKIREDVDPREYGSLGPDGTRRVHVPWSGWQRSDGQPFLQQEADR